MADDGWGGKDHPTIQADLLKLVPDDASRAGEKWSSVSELAEAANEFLVKARNNIQDGNDFWTGEGPGAAFDTLDSVYKKTIEPPKIAKEISDNLFVDAGLLASAKHVATNNPPYDAGAASSSANPEYVQKEQNRRLEKIRREAQSYYTDALDWRRASMLDQLNGEQPKYPTGTGTGMGTGGGDNSSGGGGGGGGNQNGGGTDKLTDSSGAGDTKPAFDEGAGQGQGQGAGQGGGQGSGAGGGTPPGGGSGTGGLGSGLGSDSKTGSGYSPLGNTTAAGYSPTSAAGTGTGTGAGPGALRAGGLPPGAGAGTGGAGGGGVNAGGVRGGMGGMGMGMAPMAGAHGRGGKGEDDDEHEIPSYMVNIDNGNELFGNLPKASPGVIGDWTEHDEADKRREEAEIKRYKSMGWNVKWQ